VRFAHDRTGFPLEGRHLQTACRDCHPASFSAPVPTACAGCHRDAHQGDFGTRCASCHEAASWRTKFDADAHRRTNFPLSGRHAFIPCQECHVDSRDRGFARPANPCLGCHQQDYQRAALTAIDHAAAGFGTRCQECHGSWRFAGAFFPAHDQCFQIGAGPHAGIRCLGCHTSIIGAPVTGACNTGTAACTRCHNCTAAAQQHLNVPGFGCTDLKCYQCHRFSTAGAALKGLRRKP
jgi:hypothetical protein